MNRQGKNDEIKLSGNKETGEEEKISYADFEELRFAIEALGGFQTVLPIVVATTMAFLAVEVTGLGDFTGSVIKTRTHMVHKGKQPRVIEVPLTVYKGSFVIDKELTDILWPASCTLLSIEKGPNREPGKLGIAEGDVLTVHYTTYDPVATADEFEVLVGDQSPEIDRIMRPHELLDQSTDT